jgi:ATP-dependent DNA helicase RecG
MIHEQQLEVIHSPNLVSDVAKGLMPYHGIGSGIQRALAAWPRIEFRNDHEGCLFVATVRRDEVDAPESDTTQEISGAALKTTLKTGATTPKTILNLPMSDAGASDRILAALDRDPKASRTVLSKILGDITVDGVKYHLERLQTAGRLRRIGPAKGGHWEVLS